MFWFSVGVFQFVLIVLVGLVWVSCFEVGFGFCFLDGSGFGLDFVWFACQFVYLLVCHFCGFSVAHVFLKSHEDQRRFEKR